MPEINQRYKWLPAATIEASVSVNTAYIDKPFTVTTVGTGGRFWYKYDSGTKCPDIGRPASDLALALRIDVAPAPDPKPVFIACAADCTPATPCMREIVCPAHRESFVATSPWYFQQAGWAEGSWRENPPPDYVESGCQCDSCRSRRKAPAPDLRCDRDLVCGLYRTT